jgi:hypothetical protein
MRNLRLRLTLLAAICLLALGAYALANRPPQVPGDDIIIKGGSLEIQCGTNHGVDCLGTHDAYGKYKHKKSGNHITRVWVLDSSNNTLYDSADPNHCGGNSAIDPKAEIHITYK